MIQTVIFDLSEVLIYGLVGVERELAAHLDLPEDAILSAFWGDGLQDLCCGRITEDAYLSGILSAERWSLDVESLKQAIRRNFHTPVPGMARVLEGLAGRYELALLSDHGPEWVDYIRGIHPFLSRFDYVFFSYELGSTKRDPATFRAVLERIGRAPEECLLIDDSPANIQTAASAGFPGIRFQSATQLVEALRCLGISPTPGENEVHPGGGKLTGEMDI